MTQHDTVVDFDVALIERARRGDQKAFERLYREHVGRVNGLCLRMTRNPDLAADCVQEAFVRAHVRWRRIGEYDDPVGWVRRVALNLARDHARRTARKRKAKDRLAAEGEAQERSNAPAEQPVDLLAALRHLPPQQRTALALHYVEGLPVREVAAEMGLSEGAVKFHLHGGRDRLRRSLEGVDEGGQRA